MIPFTSSQRTLCLLGALCLENGFKPNAGASIHCDDTFAASPSVGYNYRLHSTRK